MNIKIVITLVALLVFGGAIVFDIYTKPELIEISTEQNDVEMEPVPELTFTGINGDSFNFEDIKEPVILLNFWATWCGVCAQEFPPIMELVKKMEGKVALVAVSTDDTPNPIPKWQAKFSQIVGADLFDNASIYWAYDTDKQISLNKFNVIRVPETVIITPDRKMAKKIVGMTEWDGDEMVQYLNSLL